MRGSLIGLHLVWGSALLAVSLLAVGPHPANAQSLWIPRDRQTAVVLEFARPQIDGQERAWWSGAYFLDARFVSKDKFAIVGEIPFSYQDVSLIYLYPYGRDAGALGNIYIGAETVSSSSSLFAEFGMRLPTASKTEFGALGIGYLSDVARREAFYSEAVSIQAAVNARQVRSSGLMYRFRVSPLLLIPTEGSSDPELFLRSSMEVGLERPAVRASVGVNSSLLVTQSSGSDLSDAQVEFHADFLTGSIRPGVGVRIQTVDGAPASLSASLSYVN